MNVRNNTPVDLCNAGFTALFVLCAVAAFFAQILSGLWDLFSPYF